MKVLYRIEGNSAKNIKFNQSPPTFKLNPPIPDPHLTLILGKKIKNND